MLLGWRRYLDFTNRISLDLPIFSTEDCETEEAFHKKHSTEIFDMMFACLELGIESNFDTVPCFVVDGSTFFIERRDFPEKIELCLKHFEELEQYEKCAKIVELKNRFDLINEKVKTTEEE